MLGMTSLLPSPPKYAHPHAVTSDDQVKAYIKKIMSQLNKWMLGQKISKLVIVITSKETGEHVERWQFDVNYSYLKHSIETNIMKVQLNKPNKSKQSQKTPDKENATSEYVLIIFKIRFFPMLTLRVRQPLQQHPPKLLPMKRSKHKSELSSGRSRHQSLSCPNLPNRALSMCLCMPTRIPTCLLSGEIAMPKRLKVARRCS